MIQHLQNKLEWIDEQLGILMDQELPHPESMDFLVAQRDLIMTQILKEEFGKIS